MVEPLRARRLLLIAPRTFAWEEVTLPPPAPGEVRVRTRLSAVSVGSELGAVEGRVPGWAYPGRLGYQTLGVVEAVGEDVPLASGTRVVTTLGHASAGLHQASSVLPVPAGIPDRVALAAILGEETQKGIRKVVPRPDERVLVAGAGLLGLLTVFNLTRRGVRDVTVLEPEAERRALAREVGAVSALSPGSLPQDAFDVGFECSASPDGFAELLEHLRPGGRVCVLSDGNWGTLRLPPAFHTRELSVTASSDGEDYAAYARWLWQHTDPVLGRLFEGTVTPDDLPAAFGTLLTLPRPVSPVAEWMGEEA
ncbi:theronine dehydrogenase [Deinococcus metallilatus]|uniref:Alcohol dehydrogenase n=1 Tax=Deinococcus metallilatus TaxID=1211322 RepID=A0AAJ5F366_9DEIO|nr:zinc-binding alcohol dehydrogenase [Deinococcus metallilatus]MBB5295545.1 alcohol dehydrogenase [Deinococcus metallilatus]QBY07941.1 theronine dehydrogenase [Deinococcus metallilatus]RXJ12834.1 theronine dehydrogenase [Deinococcus metallilatus]TLK27244.1 theronine dehydrogenase [Deinococcus metallilatus]GMA16223.1 alcohol dehydrogenase [Deinococcus metallilatus]